MRKILLISDDFTENSKLQTVLKKVGFDASSITTTNKLQVDLLNFNPDIVVAKKVQKLSGCNVLAKVRENAFFKGKSVLIFGPDDMDPSPAELVKGRPDIVLETPLAFEKLIEVLAKLLGEDPQPFVEKFKRSNMDDSHLPPSMVVKSRKTSESDILVPEKGRYSRYDKFLKDVQIDTAQSSHSRLAIKKAQTDLVKGWDMKSLKVLDTLKQDFVRALFSGVSKSAKPKK
jgi:hypothetical protein